MTHWHSERIETNGIQLYYTRTGGDKPPVVLAHGFSDDGLCWTPVAQAVETEYDVIMVDARGHGRSDAPAAGYNPAAMADDLAGVISRLGLHKPAVLGHSMGGSTTMALAGMNMNMSVWAFPFMPLASAFAVWMKRARSSSCSIPKR